MCQPSQMSKVLLQFSSISRLAPAFQSLHFSCIILPTSLKYNLLHFPAEVLHATSHRRFPGVLLSQSLLRLRPIRPIHLGPAHWTHFVFLSILSNLSAKPWDRWWDWMAWKIRVKGRGGGQFEWRSLFYIFVGQFANAPAPGSQVRIQSWLLASLLWEAGDRKVRAEPLSSAGTISSTHDFDCRCNRTLGAT